MIQTNLARCVECIGARARPRVVRGGFPLGVMFLVWNGGNGGDAELKYGLELLAIAVGSVTGK